MRYLVCLIGQIPSPGGEAGIWHGLLAGDHHPDWKAFNRTRFTAALYPELGLNSILKTNILTTITRFDRAYVSVSWGLPVSSHSSVNSWPCALYVLRYFCVCVKF